MRSPLARFILLLSLFGGLLDHASAQDSMSVSFKTMGLVPGLTDLSIKSGQGFSTLVADVFTVSNKSYSYSGANPMILYHPEQVGGKTVISPVGKVYFPNNGASGRFLVVLTNQGGDSFAGSALPDSTSDFPAQSMRVVNVTPFKLVATVNEKNVALNPGQYGIVRVSASTDYGAAVSILRDGSLTQLVGDIYRDGPGSRRTIFFILTNADQLRANHDMLPNIRMLGYTDDPSKDNSSSN